MNINYCSVIGPIDNTIDEYKVYKGLSKNQLIEMLIGANKLLDIYVKSCYDEVGRVNKSTLEDNRVDISKCSLTGTNTVASTIDRDDGSHYYYFGN